MNALRSVAEYAIRPPYMGRHQTLEEAQRSMKTHDAPCVVVLHHGRAIGILTRRDLGIIDAVSDAPFQDITLQEAMLPSLLEVDAATLVKDVVAQMAAGHWEVAVVTESSAVLGVFTALEGVRAFADSTAHRRRRRPRIISADHPRLTAVG